MPLVKRINKVPSNTIPVKCQSLEDRIKFKYFNVDFKVTLFPLDFRN